MKAKKLKIATVTALLITATYTLWIPLAWEWFWWNTKVITKVGQKVDSW